MKILPAGMQDMLDSKVTTLCLCWKLIRTDDTVMGFTDHDENVQLNTPDQLSTGTVSTDRIYKAQTGLNASSVASSINLGIGDMDSIGALDSDEITEEDIRKKLYDNARIQLFVVNWNDTDQYTEVFHGFLGALSRDEFSFRAEVRSIASLMNQKQGRVYQKTCPVDLFSSECGLNIGDEDTYSYDGREVITPISRRLFSCTDVEILARPDGWFTGGLLRFTSGNNINFAIEIKASILLNDNSAVHFELWEPTPEPIVAGDTFYCQVGCDKAIETCATKFDNVDNFRGFPRMPGNDAIVSYTTREARNDGTSWYK